MAIEKYGVSNVKELQETELREVKGRLRGLRGSLEKTAAETQEIEHLEKRETDIRAALADQ